MKMRRGRLLCVPDMAGSGRDRAMVAPNVVKKGIRRPITAPSMPESLHSGCHAKHKRPRRPVAADRNPPDLRQETELMIRPISLLVAELPILGRLWMKLTLPASEAVRLVVASLTLATP